MTKKNAITKDTVAHVAKLANLSLSEEEKEKYSRQLSKILGYIDQLDKVSTAGTDPIFNVSGQKNVLSEDKTVASLSQEEALSNAPKRENGFFVTKGVFDNE